MHANLAPFDPNYCKSCHDYDPNNRPENTTAIATTPIGGRIYGASPIVWKVHKVHFAEYLSSPDKSRDIHNTTDHEFDNIIFPMDVRNCNKCHGMSNAWKNNPGYIACIACHDTGDAVAHAEINSTWETDATTGRSVIKAESCKVCHKAGRDFAVDKVHDYSITYLREGWTIAGEED